MFFKIDYDKIYGSVKDYFGAEPHEILKDNCRLIDKNFSVLDIGAGQGRNSLFLAKMGYRIDAIDKSRVSANIIKNKAEIDKLSICVRNCRFQNFKPDRTYSAVLLFGIIQELTAESIKDLSEKVNSWTKKGSLLFVTAHTIEDPEYKIAVAKYKKTGKNSFLDNYGNVKTFMERDEVSKIFNKFTKIYYKEEPGKLHSHDGVNTHRHGSVKAVLKKF